MIRTSMKPYYNDDEDGLVVRIVIEFGSKEI